MTAAPIAQRPIIAITLGDPRGIGPEIARKALADARITALDVSWHVVGPTGLDIPVDSAVGHWSMVAPHDTSTGHVQALAGRLAGAAVERAAHLAMSGEVQGIVTAPLDKAALLAGGYDFPGHTEMLGAIAGVHTTMMLASDRLRVTLATTHIPLRDVPDAVTRPALRRAIETTRAGLQETFGIAQPRLALCALNPHAGDGGRFGPEDDELLAPVARECGIAGPFPADTVFVRAIRGEFDAVIAPYHDVGMTAIKVASFGSAVNVTLGLPFVRTSPDHGTALDIAGKGIASPESMVAAMTLAAEVVVRRRTAN